MADRAHSTTSRRTLLAAPVLVPVMASTAPSAAALPASVIPLPAVPGACFELGRQAGRLIREYQMTERDSVTMHGRSAKACSITMRELSDEIDERQERILRTRAVTALDVVAKLLVARVVIGRAKDDAADYESCLQADDAVRDCIIAITDLTGASLIELGADWMDHLLCVQMEPELRRVLPEIYGA